MYKFKTQMLGTVFCILMAVAGSGLAAKKPVVHATKQTKVNINQANATVLAKLPGMSLYKARAIVAYRKKHGKFKKLATLQQVKGFKRVKKEKLAMMIHKLSI